MVCGSYGELGNGKTDISDEPVQAIFPNGTKIVEVASGENHALALDEEGNVWGWGRNQMLLLGDTGAEYISTPTKISGLDNIRKIACANNTSYAIGIAGEVYSFRIKCKWRRRNWKLYKQNTCNKS